MFYCYNKDGEMFNLQLLKTGVDKKSKVTKKSHQINVVLGEVYPPEGASIFHLPGTQTFYFTGKYK